MNLRSKLLWSAAVNLGFLNNRDITELLNLGAIKVFYEIFTQEFFNRINNIECSDKVLLKLKEIRRNLSNINNEAAKYEKIMKEKGMFVITEEDDDYPYYWKCLTGMPRLIYGIGKRDIIETESNGAIAIVGSRKCSRYSEVVTAEFTSAFVNSGITIISGMASGIDRVAHQTALSNNGKTIAFLAGGVDNIYPWSNKDIYDALSNNGLVLSEMPPGTKAMKQYFPSRNRLISSLSDTCLIMEAGQHSGTLHTASFAAAQGKTVFVLPNSIYCEENRGGLELIADGASILIDAQSVIDEVSECCFYKLINSGKSIISKKIEDEINDTATRIVDELKVKPRSADELVRITSVSYSELSIILSELEIKGKIIVQCGKYALTI